MTLTSHEQEVLKAIAENEFQDFPGKEGIISHPVWSDCIYCGVSGKALSGVISSLSKKGLMEVSHDNTLWITKEGFQAYKERGN